MTITFTAQQRLDITRRQLNILQENAGYATTTTSLTAQQAQLLNVDSGNAVFYNFQTGQVNLYETEVRQLNGTIPATYSDGIISPFSAGDLSSSAQTPGSTTATFFPNTPPYAFFVPKEIDAINGYTNSISKDAGYEMIIISNSLTTPGISDLIGILLNGISGSGANASTTTSIPTGVVTGLVVNVSSAVGFAVNDHIYITDGTGTGIYQITAITLSPPSMDTITINSIFPTLIGIGSGTVTAGGVGFTNAQRTTLTASPYQELLTNLTNGIATLITAWIGKITTQKTELTSQQETRSTQQAQNASAISSNNAALTVLNNWVSLPTTGATGRYTNAGLSSIQTEITTRQSYITTRVPQIVTALGSVTVSGNTFSGVTGSPYYERYNWLNNRINTASGSARRYFAANQGIGFLGVLTANNTAIATDYSAYFLTKAIKVLDTTPIIQVTDLTGIAQGDTLTVVSETQPEITRAVIKLMGTTQIVLDKSIPNTYKTTDQVRIFKTL